MSKKAIPFQISQKSAAGAPAVALATVSSIYETSADDWVHQPETFAASPVDPNAFRQAATSVTITISVEPDWFDAAKIAFFLPYLTFWWWTLSAAQRSLRFLAH